MAREANNRYNVFQNEDRGWSLTSLARELGTHHKTVLRQLKRAGLKLESRAHGGARPTLTERDIETVMAVVLRRKSERLYGH